MSDEEHRKDDPGTDPETQRQEISRRGYAPHPAHERNRTLNTTRPGEAKEGAEEEPENEPGAKKPKP